MCSLDKTTFHNHSCLCLKARLHRPAGFLSQQLDAIIVAQKLYQVSNMFETPAISRRQIALKIAPSLHVRFWNCNLSATKIASSCRDKNRLCKRALTMLISWSWLLTHEMSRCHDTSVYLTCNDQNLVIQKYAYWLVKTKRESNHQPSPHLSCYSAPTHEDRGCFLLCQCKGSWNFGRKSNGTGHFGFFQPQYSEVVHLFRSDQKTGSLPYFTTYIYREFRKRIKKIVRAVLNWLHGLVSWENECCSIFLWYLTGRFGVMEHLVCNKYQIPVLCPFLDFLGENPSGLAKRDS